MTLITYMGRNHYHEPLPNWLEESLSKKEHLYWKRQKMLIFYDFRSNFGWHLEYWHDYVKNGWLIPYRLSNFKEGG